MAKVTSSDRNARVGTVGRTALPSFSESLQSNPPIGFFLGLASLFLRTESLLSVSSTLTVPTLLLKTPFQTFPLPVRDIPHALQPWQVRLEALVSSVVIFQVFPLHYRKLPRLSLPKHRSSRKHGPVLTLQSLKFFLDSLVLVSNTFSLLVPAGSQPPCLLYQPSPFLSAFRLPTS